MPDPADRPDERLALDGRIPQRMGAVINRLGAHYLECARAEIAAGAGLLDGFVIWGDVAYKKCMLLAPVLEGLFQTLGGKDHRSGPRGRSAGDLPRLRQRQAILPDFIEIGVDGYNPLEAKAGLTLSNCVASSVTRSPSAATARFRSGNRATARRFAARSCAS